MLLKLHYLKETMQRVSSLPCIVKFLIRSLEQSVFFHNLYSALDSKELNYINFDNKDKYELFENF